MTRYSFLLCALCALCGGLIGCTKALPNPEEIDPIYRDLEARASLHQKDADEGKAKLTELAEAKAKAEPNSIEKREIEKDLAKVHLKFRDADQWAHYYKIRVERRKFEDHLTYGHAFATGTAWPPPAEYAEYQVNRRLVESPRNWNLRVPKSKSRIPSAAETPKAKPEGKPE